MRKLDEYRTEIEKGERGEYQDAPGNPGATAAMFGAMYNEIKNAAWQHWAKADALDLQTRANFLAHDPKSQYARRD